MDRSTLKHASDWFRSLSLRKIDDPSGKIDRREFLLPLDQYPHDFGLGPNPRRPDPKSRVARDVRDTLENNGENFHLLNRGITVLAKGLDYDNKTERIRLHLHESEDEESQYGILDGGNTNHQINDWRDALPDEIAREELKRRFVNVQVLVPREAVLTSEIDALLNDIKEARNNSVQVKQKSLADARHHFDVLKRVLADQPYYGQIQFKEGDKGSIDVLQIISLLMLFYPPFSQEAPDREPNGAYGRKEKCLDSFLHYSEVRGEDLERWIGIVPELLRLFDEMQFTFPELYPGRIGKIAEVKIYDEPRYEKGNKKFRKTPSKSLFLSRDMRYEYPTGWLYPIFAGMRELVGPNGVWKKDPQDFWSRHGREICARYEVLLKDVGYETNKISRNPIPYSAIRGAVRDLHQSELLAQAGITA